LVEPPAWEQPVDGAALLDAIVAELRRYLIMPEHAPEAVTLWILYAHALDAFQCSPILALLSPEKRCGKTTALSVIAKIVPKGVFASNTSPAAVYRIIEKWRPTLLVDEMDTFIEDNNELRGIINSGHHRSASFVMRVSGDELEPKLYSTWAPKVVAMIGKLPGTLSDRAIEVSLKRKRPDERVTRFRTVRPGDLPDLKRKAIRWSADNLISLRDGALEVSVPDGLNDRACDNWEPLLTIADRAGGEWPVRARKAALALSGNGAADDPSLSVMLLSDIRAVFERRALERAVQDQHWSRIPSKDLADALAAKEGRPWAEWRGKPITPNALARQLKPFDIKPDKLRFGTSTANGYERSWFDDAFARYLPSPSDSPPANGTSGTALKSNENSKKANRTLGIDVPIENGGKANEISDVPDVPVQNHPSEREGKKRGDDSDGGDDALWELIL
jgi:putative DNA primase/helicase